MILPDFEPENAREKRTQGGLCQGNAPEEAILKRTVR
jgi:hypothetical protein